MITVKELMEMQQAALYDPVAMAEASFATMEGLEINGGDISVVDPSNPVVLSLTNQSILASTIMEHNADLIRKQYPYMARTVDDLYLHMSDKDFVGRFANPSRITAMFRIQVDDLIQRMVPVPEFNCSQLVIPRNSTLTVDGLEFTLLYPIVIKKYDLGKFAITYDTDHNSPLQDLSTNIIKYKITKFKNLEWLTFTFDMLQLKITTANDTLSMTAETRLNVPFPDEYCNCRVFNITTASDGTKKRTELKTAHNSLVYDTSTPTAILSVSNKSLEVYIPAIYTNTGKLNYNSTIQIDVYSTRGDIGIGLGGYALSEFVFKLHSTFKEDINGFVSPLTLMNTMQVFSGSMTSGGSRAMTFEELKEKVISGGMGSNIPISSNRLKYALRDFGYDVILNIDNINTRVFLATKDMPTPKNERLHSPIATAIETFVFGGWMSEINKGIIEHANAYTITPSCLFKINNGQVALVPDTVLNQLDALTPSSLATMLNNNNYYWTPFYYVVDVSNNQLDLRAYHLDEPDILTMSFETENTTTDLKSSTVSYEIKKTTTGYELFIYTECSDAYKKLETDKIWMQLSFLPSGSNVPATVNGTLYGEITDGYAWSFKIETNYNCNADDELILTNFVMFDSSGRYIPVPLEATFNVLHGVNTSLNNSFREIDSERLVNHNALPQNAKALTHEYITVSFGKNLSHLWRQARSFAALQYEVCSDDIPLRYEEDVYEKYPDGSIFQIINNELHYNIINYKGEIVTIDGEVQYANRKGEPLVQHGSPVLSSDRYLNRHIDILLMDAAFRFADADNIKRYLATTMNSIITWSTVDMERISPILLEDSNIYFTPKKTASVVNIQLDNKIVQIEAAQSLTVTYDIIGAYNDVSSIEDPAIAKTVSEVIANEFASYSIISLNALEDKIKRAVGESVLNVSVSGLGGDLDLKLVILNTNAHRLTIAKKVKSRPNGELYIEDDITLKENKIIQK